MTKEQLKENYERVLSQIRELDPEHRVTLLLATKTQSVEDINYLISLGAVAIGENRVNEIREKYESLDKSASLPYNERARSRKRDILLRTLYIINRKETA